MKNYYISFNHFVLRSPLLPFNRFLKMLSDVSNSEEDFRRLFNDPIIQEAIYLASPNLYKELLKYIDNKLPNRKEEERLIYSLIRYLSRMSTRCTPFGIFAGCSIGNFGEISKISLCDIPHYKRHTRLDMNYLCALSQKIASTPEIKERLTFYCNSSIYKVGDKIRYVEYYYKGTRRIHKISFVQSSEFLDRILQEASNGATIEKLISLLVCSEIDSDEAVNFIDELIDSQILLSDFEPTVTGPELLQQILSKIRNLNTVFQFTEPINIFVNKLNSINKLILNNNKVILGSHEYYDQIVAEIKSLETPFEPKFLFQVDLIKPTKISVLDKTIVKDILKGIEILNKFSFPNIDSNLSMFKEAFYERYETREMPLLLVLDTESGIGYKRNLSANDLSPLIDDLNLPQQNKTYNDIRWNNLYSLILRKFHESLSINSTTIEFSEKELEHLETRWDDLPSTISALCEIFHDDVHDTLIHLKAITGSSAAKLLGRFCHADMQINEHVFEIIQKEEELEPGVLFAEIVHLPESRTGNILLRPILRSFEIPYLAKSSVKKSQQIDLSDLMISIKNDKILLRSKRLNREIVPRLSSAHNYSSMNSMPLYHFLCDLQMQNQRTITGFNWGTICNEFNRLPRVIYRNLILSRARWSIKQEDIKFFFEILDDGLLAKSVNKWRQISLLPRYLLLTEGDNELFVDLENTLSIRTLLSAVKRKKSFFLEEFFFETGDHLVTCGEDYFRNEFILSFYKGEC